MSGWGEAQRDDRAASTQDAIARLLTRISPAIISVIGPGPSIVELGGHLLEELGFDPSTLHGTRADTLVGGRVLEALEAALDGEPAQLTDDFHGRRWNVLIEPVAPASPDDEPRAVCVLTYDDFDVIRALATREEDLEKFAALVEMSSDFIAIATPEGRVTYLNRAGLDLVGLPDLEAARDRPTVDYFTEHGLSKSQEIEASVLGRGAWEGETELRHFVTGESIPVSCNSFLVTRSATGEPLALATVQRDLRSRMRSEQRLARLAAEQRSVAELGRLALTVPFPDLMVAATRLVTERYPDLRCSIVRRSSDASTLQLIAGVDPSWEGRIFPLEPGTVSATALATDRTTYSHDMRTDDGFVDTSEVNGMRSALCSPIPGTDGPWGLIGAAGSVPYDWSDDDVAFVESVAAMLGAAVRRYDLEDRLQHQALHDVLTGLPNRSLVLDRIQHALDRSARGTGLLAVLLLDLDDFKTVNDSLGHGVGDLLLSELARRLQDAVRPGDTVARLGGDEFVVLCEDLSDEDEVALVAEKVLESCAPGVELAGHRVSLSASVGVALAFDGEGSTSGLLSEADIAMYRAKRDRPGTYRIFDEAMRGDVLGRLNVAGELRAAIRSGELTVAYQPIIDLTTGEVQAFEALARWTTPAGDVVPPDVFIPVAEETGLIGELGQLVLGTAVREAVAWQPLGKVGLRVNVSAHELRAPTFFAGVQGTLASHGLDSGLLGLEVTESIFIDEDKVTQDNLSRLGESGVGLLIDDFGTGYSSLSYLQRFPLVDVLKIDRSFLGEDGHGEAVVRAVVGLGHAFGFKVCAEGVETAEHHSRVTRLGCDYAQGYYLGRPMPVEEVRELLASWEPLLSE